MVVVKHINVLNVVKPKLAKNKQNRTFTCGLFFCNRERLGWLIGWPRSVEVLFRSAQFWVVDGNKEKQGLLWWSLFENG